MEVNLSYFLTGSISLSSPDWSPAAYMISGLFPGGIPYFGSTICPPRRGREHVYDLEDGTHWCRELQFDYDKHGPDQFIFVTLEAADDLWELSRLEQAWINSQSGRGQLYNTHRNVPKRHCAGYKLSAATRRKQSKAKRNRPIEQTRARRYRFLNPAGELIETHGLREICEKHDLNASHMSKVANGEAKAHKGFTRAPDSRND